MAWTELGTVKSPSERQARVRETRVHALADRPDLEVARRPARDLIAKSATTSLNWPTRPWSDPNTIALVSLRTDRRDGPRH